MSTLRIVLVGDEKVGKSSLIWAYNAHMVPDSSEISQGPPPSDTMQFVGGRPLKIYSTEVQASDMFEKMRVLSYAGTDAFLVCFSVADKSSYDHVRDKWIPEMKKHLGASLDVPVVLVGLKTDSARAVTKEDGDKCASMIGNRKYMECSAKNQSGVDAVFDEAIKQALADYQKKGKEFKKDEPKQTAPAPAPSKPTSSSSATPAATAPAATAASSAPSAATKKATFTIKIKGGEKLAARDSNGKSDPFCVVKMLNKDGSEDVANTWKTKVFKKSLFPLWSEEHVYTNGFDEKWGKFQIQVFDHETIGAPRSMGQYEVPIGNLVVQKDVDGWYKEGKYEACTLEKQPGDKLDVSGHISIAALLETK